ncbi:MAG: hypothetical protein JSR48_11375 [Verrucomicrobia bacterium]|nr:hypothetical protein [Verrucomicrobiota bacterium]
MPRSAPVASLLACLILGGLGGARAGEGLAASSPFLPPTAGGATPAEATPLELRGIMADGAGYRFSIFDPTRHTGTWARVNETGYDFVIRSYDPSRDLVTLDYQGRVLTLALRTAKVAAAPAAPAAGAGNTGAAGPNPPVVLNPTPADEVARFNRVKEEIARRRALREQAAAQAQQASPQRR